jgi:putative FmdB family regulatory protein
MVLRSESPLRWHSYPASASDTEDVVPTYEYRCKSCSTELEVVQSFTDDPLTTCEACGGDLRKVFAAPGIAFKGSGFYKTDSRSGSSSSSSSSDSGGEMKDSDKKDKDSKDSKPSSEKKDAKAGKSETSSSGSGDKATKAPAAASSGS